MKGLILGNIYASKKPLIWYSIMGIIFAIIMAFFNPFMTCFMAGGLLISPITDNIKREKESRWMYYVATLPTGRRAYVNSYLYLYGTLGGVGIVVGALITLIITQHIGLTAIAIFLGIGAVGSYAIVFPLTFKFGAENSNVILIFASIIMLILFFITLFIGIMPTISNEHGFVVNARNLTWAGVNGAIGLILFIISYISSHSIFNKQEL